MNTKLMLLIMSLFLTLSASAGIDPKEAYSQVVQGEAVLIDVREKDEVKQGMIKRAVWFPMSKIQSDPNWKKDFEKITDGKEVFLYCRTGNRSEKVKKILKKNEIESKNIGGYLTLQHILPVTE